MTCKEKYMQEHPDESISEVIKNHCPHHFSYIDELYICPGCAVGEDNELCKLCWNREIPETPPCGSEDVLDKLEHENEKEKENMCTCAKIIAYMNENQILKGHIEQLNKTNEDLANKLAAARAETERTVDAWEACSELRDNMAEKIAELEDRVFEQSREIEKMSDAHKIDVDTIRMLHARIEELNEANKNLRAEKDAMAAGKAKALDEAETKIKNLQTKFNSVLRQLDNATRNYDNLLDKNRKLREAYADLERCNNTQAESIKDLLKSNDKFKEDIESRDMHIKYICDKNKWLNDQLDAKNKCIQELCARIDKMDEAIYIKQDITMTEDLYEFFKQSRPIVIPKEEPTIRPVNELPYARYASHIRMKYKALTDSGFSHDDAMALIPMWDDNEFEGFKHDGFRAAVTFVDEMHEHRRKEE